jgi:superfamily II DNA/RNA helicase
VKNNYKAEHPRPSFLTKIKSTLKKIFSQNQTTVKGARFDSKSARNKPVRPTKISDSADTWVPGDESPRRRPIVREGERRAPLRKSSRHSAAKSESSSKIDPVICKQLLEQYESQMIAEINPPPYSEAFSALGLNEVILSAIKASGYEVPTQIQADAIPVILSGKDVVGASQTGTGKTAAFALPILAKLEKHQSQTRCLILEPTRELAAQVLVQLEKYGAHTNLRSLLVHGGVGYGKQAAGLEIGVDIIVATPGRLLEFMRNGTFKTLNIEILVLDEVDRMLDMGFLPDVRQIIQSLPEKRQTLMFSATMPSQIKSLADFALIDPVAVQVAANHTASTISHWMYPVASDQRQELLLAILRETHFNSLMVFTRTKAQADEIYSALQATQSYKVAVMHSDINQKNREQALQDFRAGAVEIIVATDVAARGIDVSTVTHVINYMVPESPEDYVHRIGRTGRAERDGDAFTLFAADEIGQVESIERLINQKIPRRKLENFQYKYTTILENEKVAKAILFGRKRRR